MAKVTHSLLVVIAALGLLTALGWTGASLAAPSLAAQAHEDGCGHAMAPTHRHGPTSFADEMCATCCAVLPPLARIAPRALPHLAPAQAGLQPLSGIDPGLDPPPPRAG